jgi:hypothetical protein
MEHGKKTYAFPNPVPRNNLPRRQYSRADPHSRPNADNEIPSNTGLNALDVVDAPCTGRTICFQCSMPCGMPNFSHTQSCRHRPRRSPSLSSQPLQKLAAIRCVWALPYYVVAGFVNPAYHILPFSLFSMWVTHPKINLSPCLHSPPFLRSWRRRCNHMKREGAWSIQGTLSALANRESGQGTPASIATLRQ